jgi:hypothetical protein
MLAFMNACGNGQMGMVMCLGWEEVYTGFFLPHVSLLSPSCICLYHAHMCVVGGTVAEFMDAIAKCMLTHYTCTTFPHSPFHSQVEMENLPLG